MTARSKVADTGRHDEEAGGQRDEAPPPRPPRATPPRPGISRDDARPNPRGSTFVRMRAFPRRSPRHRLRTRDQRRLRQPLLQPEIGEASIGQIRDRQALGSERHQPPPGRGRDCWFVANREPGHGLPLCPARDPNQKSGEARTGPARWLPLRGGAPDYWRWPTRDEVSLVEQTCGGLPGRRQDCGFGPREHPRGSCAGLDGPRRAMSGSSAAIVLMTTAAQTASMTLELPARRPFFQRAANGVLPPGAAQG